MVDKFAVTTNARGYYIVVSKEEGIAVPAELSDRVWTEEPSAKKAIEVYFAKEEAAAVTKEVVAEEE